MGRFSALLDIKKGVTAIIGGGGKTTLMHLLAQELSQTGSVIVTTSTHIFKPTQLPFSETAERVQGILCVGTPDKGGKLTAPRQSFAELARLADYVLVEADGSKGLPLKAHHSHEPVIPKEAHQVICVVGASGLERPVEEAAHRPERYAALAESRWASPEAAARVLEKEALHSRVLINQADSPQRIHAAKALASFLHCPVAVVSLQKGEILCSF